MISKLLSNPYAKSELGNRRFGKYGIEMIGRVKAADFPADSWVGLRLASCEASYQAFIGSVKVGAVASAVRQGTTVTNDSAIRRLQRTISQQAKLISGQLADPDAGVKGEDTAIFEEFFPKGVPAITRANKANIETETNTFWEAAKRYPHLGTPGLAARIEQLLSDVINSRGEQLEEGKGEETQAENSRDLTRTALATALFRLTLALLDHHAEDPEQVWRYVNQAILSEPTGKKRKQQDTPNNPS